MCTAERKLLTGRKSLDACIRNFRIDFIQMCSGLKFICFDSKLFYNCGYHCVFCNGHARSELDYGKKIRICLLIFAS